MKYDKVSIAQLVAMADSEIDIKALWYDWFCKDTSLENKGLKLLKKLRMIANSKKFDATKCYVFFKNNCPMVGSLYDDFRICDMETGDVLFCVVPSSGFLQIKGKAFVYSDETGWRDGFGGSWRDVKAWFLS